MEVKKNTTAEIATDIIEGMMDPVVITDLEGRITKFNKALTEFFGWGKDVMGELPTIFVAERDIPKVMDGIKECLEKGFLRNLECTGLTKDKKETPVLLNVKLIRDPKGNPTGMMAVARGITELRRAEDERARAAALATTVDAMVDPVFVLDLEGRCVFANRAYFQMFGLESKDVVGKSIMEIPGIEKQKPEEVEKFMPLIREAIERGSAGPVELVLVSMDGRENPSSLAGGVIKDSRGNPTHVVAVLRNITSLKRAEEQAKRLREYLQLQVNRMPIGLIVWDKEFRVRTWNPAATKIFGFTEEEVLGKHPYGLIVPKEVQPQVDDIWRRLLEGDLTAYSVNENITKDGRTIICDWANTPLKEADGTVIGVLSMVQDITERKRMEEALKARVEELEEFHELAVGRELKMKQMEVELERLRDKGGES